MKRFTFGDDVRLRMTNSDGLREELDATCDRTTFQLLGHPVYPVLDAPDAIGWDHRVVIDTTAFGGPRVISDVETTYTYDQPARQGRRTRTRSDGTTMTFDYDADGRLLAIDGDATTYAYDGALLIEIRRPTWVETFEYDAADNLVRSITSSLPEDPSSASVTTYSYACW